MIILRMACPENHKTTVVEGKSLYDNCPHRIRPAKKNDYRKVCTQPLRSIGTEYRCDRPGCSGSVIQKHWQDRIDLTGWRLASYSESEWTNGEFVLQARGNLYFCSLQCRQHWTNPMEDSALIENMARDRQELDRMPKTQFVIQRNKSKFKIGARTVNK